MRQTRHVAMMDSQVEFGQVTGVLDVALGDSETVFFRPFEGPGGVSGGRE
jgi:hypothetical protein